MVERENSQVYSSSLGRFRQESMSFTGQKSTLIGLAFFVCISNSHALTPWSDDPEPVANTASQLGPSSNPLFDVRVKATDANDSSEPLIAECRTGFSDAGYAVRISESKSGKWRMQWKEISFSGSKGWKSVEWMPDFKLEKNGDCSAKLRGRKQTDPTLSLRFKGNDPSRKTLGSSDFIVRTEPHSGKRLKHSQNFQLSCVLTGQIEQNFKGCKKQKKQEMRKPGQYDRPNALNSKPLFDVRVKESLQPDAAGTD